MNRKEIEKAFAFLKKHENFHYVQERLDDGYRIFVFKIHGLHAIKFPEEKEGDMRWYFYDRGTNMFSEDGDSLEKTDEWFQDLVKRTQLSFESAIKNIEVKEVPLAIFDSFKKHDFFHETEELRNGTNFIYLDERRYKHLLHIPKTLDREMHWYYYEPKLGKEFESRRGDSLSDTSLWFQELVEKVEVILDGLKTA